FRGEYSQRGPFGRLSRGSSRLFRSNGTLAGRRTPGICQTREATHGIRDWGMGIMQPPRLPQAPDIELHIGELLVHGFAPVDRYRLAEAFRTELVRLVRQNGLPGSVCLAAADPAFASGLRPLNAGSFCGGERESPEALGEKIAQRVYGGLTR